MQIRRDSQPQRVAVVGKRIPGGPVIPAASIVQRTRHSFPELGPRVSNPPPPAPPVRVVRGRSLLGSFYGCSDDPFDLVAVFVDVIRVAAVLQAADHVHEVAGKWAYIPVDFCFNGL